jgi:hypothetical protein
MAEGRNCSTMFHNGSNPCRIKRSNKRFRCSCHVADRQDRHLNCSLLICKRRPKTCEIAQAKPCEFSECVRDLKPYFQSICMTQCLSSKFNSFERWSRNLWLLWNWKLISVLIKSSPYIHFLNITACLFEVHLNAKSLIYDYISKGVSSFQILGLKFCIHS